MGNGFHGMRTVHICLNGNAWVIFCLYGFMTQIQQIRGISFVRFKFWCDKLVENMGVKSGQLTHALLKKVGIFV
ncbi:MAG: hypothetical protein RJA00_871 [Bacteroidota bacterium]|jgi:hypothetical protein